MQNNQGKKENTNLICQIKLSVEKNHQHNESREGQYTRALRQERLIGKLRPIVSY